MKLLHRRHPADIADLATLQHQLDRERAHSTHLASQLAEAHELQRRLIDGRDQYRGRCRELVADVVNLKAQLRARTS